MNFKFSAEHVETLKRKIAAQSIKTFSYSENLRDERAQKFLHDCHV